MTCMWRWDSVFGKTLENIFPCFHFSAFTFRGREFLWRTTDVARAIWRVQFRCEQCRRSRVSSPPGGLLERKPRDPVESHALAVRRKHLSQMKERMASVWRHP